MMEDIRILELFRARDERAIEEVSKKYGKLCRSVAFGILCDDADSEECENDVYLGLWNSIPPASPECLSAYIVRITRNLSLKRLRDRNAKKRGGGEVPLALDELAECIPSEDEVRDDSLSAILDGFLSSLGEDSRRVFVCRYFYFDSIAEISARFGYSESKVKSMLMRTRSKLYCCLRKENILK